MIRLRQEIYQLKLDAERLANCENQENRDGRRLPHLSWPQPWLVEAILYLVLYELPGVRFSHGCLWKAKGRITDDL